MDSFVPEVDISLKGTIEVAKDPLVVLGCNIPPLVVNSDSVRELSVENVPVEE